MPTVQELARQLGIAEIRLRDYFRNRFPRPAEQKNSPWNVTAEMVLAAREYFGHSLKVNGEDTVVEITQKDLNNLKHKASICENKLRQVSIIVKSKTKPKKAIAAIVAILDT